MSGASFTPSWAASSSAAQARRAAMLARIDAWRALEDRAAQTSAAAKPVFDKRGQLLPRERVALLLDRGAPWLPLCTLAGYLQDHKDPAKSVPGGGALAGIGFVQGVRCMVVASDSGIDAGAIQPMGLDKILRAQEIALQNRLPFIHLVESAGANLMRYRVEGFAARLRHGGRGVHARLVGHRDHGARAIARLFGRPSLAEGGHGRGGDRRRTGRCRDAHQPVGLGRIPGRRRPAGAGHCAAGDYRIF